MRLHTMMKTGMKELGLIRHSIIYIWPIYLPNFNPIPLQHPVASLTPGSASGHTVGRELRTGESFRELIDPQLTFTPFTSPHNSCHPEFIASLGEALSKGYENHHIYRNCPPYFRSLCSYFVSLVLQLLIDIIPENSRRNWLPYPRSLLS